MERIHLSRRHLRGTSRTTHVARGAAAIRAVVERLESRLFLAANPIVLENQLPGTPQSEWDIAGAGNMSIQGFATDISVNHGQTVNFKIDDQGQVPYEMEIYRLGYYGGDGARLVATQFSTPAHQIDQPAGIYDPTTGLLDCGNWAVTDSWAVPATATSGIYFAKVSRLDTGAASHVFFIVRNDGGHSDMLFQTSDTTWEAYNPYGGQSLYDHQSPAGKAVKVSYNRPFIDRDVDGINSFVLTSEYPMVRWMEKNGYDVSYFTCVDSARYGSEIQQHKVFMSVGHDEYWSGEMRANVQAARDAGVNLAFFSGNEGFWKVRWENSVDGTGTPYRTLVCYKESEKAAKTDPLPTVWTGTWRDPRFSPPADGGLPENQLSGTIFMVNSMRNDPIYVPADDGKLRFWRNTDIANLAPGQTATLPAGVLGYEWDEDLDNGFRPAGLIDMSHTTLSVDRMIDSLDATYSAGVATHSLTLYKATSGALVFGAGTVQWSWGLDDVHDRAGTPVDSRMQQATVNLFADMHVQPQTLQSNLVAATASTDLTAPTSTITSPLNGATAFRGNTITITGTATDGGGGAVGGVEVSVDGGLTWHPATGRGSWQYVWQVAASGTIHILSRATDDSANIETPKAGVTVTVQGQQPVVSIWGSGVVPSGAPATDAKTISSGGVELGLKFQADTAGHVLGVRFYKGSGNTGVHTGSLWDSAGNLLATATFSGETSSGWQTVQFSDPVAVEPGQTYTVSYHTTQDKWARDLDYFATSGVNSSPLQALSNTAGGGNGVYRYGTGGVMPASAYRSSNYWVDVLFTLGDVTPPTVTSQGPAPGATGVYRNVGIKAGFSEAIDPASGTLLVQDSGGNTVTGVLNYNATTYQLTFQPAVLLAALTTYTVTISGVTDVAGNAMKTPVSWSFTTVPPDNIPPTLISETPAANATGVARNTLVTATFSEPIDSSSAHPVMMDLRDSSGVAIAGGWTYDDATQIVTFVPGSLLADGITYTMTVTSAKDLAGNMMAPMSWSFTTVDTTAPTVISRNPAANATNVAQSTAIAVGFSEAINAASVVLSVQANGGGTVAGSSSYNTTSHVVTFQPTAALAASTTYTVNVSGAADTSGNVMTAPVSWSFTTAAPLVTSGVFDNVAAPTGSGVNDTQTTTAGGVELGMKFRSDAAGQVLGVKFYKGASNTGVHTGSLWSSTGQLLATVTFANETASGWQQALFSSPVTIVAGQTYVVSYHTTTPMWMANLDYFASGATTNGSLHGLQDGTDGGNGVYGYGTGGVMPASSYRASNYWADVIFSAPTVDTTPPTVTSQSPAANATNVAQFTAIAVGFSEAINAASVVLSVQANGGGTVAGSSSYNTTTHVVTFQPTAALAASTTYTVNVSGAADTSGNVMTAPVSWSFTTVVVDTTPPTVTSQSPAANATNVAQSTAIAVGFSEAINAASVVLSVQANGGGTVAGSSSYNTTTHVVTFQPTAALAASTTYTVNVSGAADLAGNVMTAPVSWSFTTAAVSTTPIGIFDNTAAPTGGGIADQQTITAGGVELGMKFRSDVAGQVLGVKFYKGASNTGVHTGSLWSSTGQLLATVTFSNETSSGWQQALFSSPVTIVAGQTYVVSYHTTTNMWMANLDYFASGGTNNGSLHGLQDGTDGGNGVYGYGTGGVMPSSSYRSTNYWADVIFGQTTVVDTTPPTVTSQSPAANATNVAQSTAIAVGFSEAINASSVVLSVQANGGGTVAGSSSYSTTTHVVTFQPTAALAASITYTVNVSGAADLAGNVMTAPVSWSFTTAATSTTPESIWSDTTVPTGSAATDPGTISSGGVELGMKFRSDVAGQVLGVKFYKGAGNTGVHTGSLWSSTGQLLATVTFVNETSSGWQQALFSSPVTIVAGQTYTISYHTTQDQWMRNLDFFAASEANTGPLHGLRDGVDGGNGVYQYGSGNVMPASSYRSTNYWVDVLFSETTVVDTTPPTVTSQSPAANATNVAQSTAIAVGFSEAINAASVVLSVQANGGGTVAGSSSYNSTTHVVTFQPTAALAASTTYTVNVSGAADMSGNVMTAPVSWSFTTAAVSTTPIGIFDNTAAPTGGGIADQQTITAGGVELGMKFRSDVAGQVLGVKFYKGASNTGVHTGSLWSSTGQLLATVTFSNETSSGWQQALFSSPVNIQAGQTYVVSYHTTTNMWMANLDYFASGGTNNGSLHGLQDGTDGGNGVYGYGTGGVMPSSSYRSTNYWVDVLFVPS